ncbi:MAG: site-2 protease family protein [Candidatus Nitrosoabyssus spongiisocia]|nr:MAG: site-2 protease family protein [Nitrosopumilaceae archaeon AB1(1)]
MSDSSREEIVSLVDNTFDVVHLEYTPSLLLFQLSDDVNYKSKFIQLCHILDKKNLIAKLERAPDSTNLYLQIFKTPPIKSKKISRAWIQRILFIIVVTFVMIDGYSRSMIPIQAGFGSDPIQMAILYTITMLGILGTHEAGHLIAAKFHKVKSSWPYFIPGIPIYGFPTFGAFIRTRGVIINRNILFDIAISGPITGFIVIVLVTFSGVYLLPTHDQILQQQVPIPIDSSQGTPLLIMGVLALTGRESNIVWISVSPILFAAWFGCLLTFLNLLPAWQLDGGHMARTILSGKLHQYATYASAGILFLLGYYVMAMMVILFNTRRNDSVTLDDVTRLSKNRYLLFILVGIMGILCVPFPVWLL